MKVALLDKTEVETEMDSEALYTMCRAAQNGYARCCVEVTCGRRRLFLNVVYIDIDKTFADIILEAYRDTVPPSKPFP